MTNAKAKTAKPSAAQANVAGNPLALVAGGIAIGAVVGLLLPRLDKERELLAPVGAKLADRARDTIDAAKEAGRAEFEGLLPSRDNAKEKVGALFGNIVEAARTAAVQKG